MPPPPLLQHPRRFSSLASLPSSRFRALPSLMHRCSASINLERQRPYCRGPSSPPFVFRHSCSFRITFHDEIMTWRRGEKVTVEDSMSSRSSPELESIWLFEETREYVLVGFFSLSLFLSFLLKKRKRKMKLFFRMPVEYHLREMKLLLPI